MHHLAESHYAWLYKFDPFSSTQIAMISSSIFAFVYGLYFLYSNHMRNLTASQVGSFLYPCYNLTFYAINMN